MPVIPPFLHVFHARLARLWSWLRRPWIATPLLLVVLLWSADRLFPLQLPGDDLARVVLAEDGTPLWRFADAEGVWRYPITPEKFRLITWRRC